MIVFDLQATQSLGSGLRGIGRYTADLASALLDRHGTVVDAFSWNADAPLDRRILDIVPADRLVSLDELAGRHVDLFHISSPFEPLTTERVISGANVGALVATCYDLIPLRFQRRYLIPLARSEYLTRATLLHTCDAILTDSQSAADDCVELLDIPVDRLTVIGGGTNPCFRPPTDSLSARIDALRHTLPAIRPGFVFLPTGMDWRKNIEGALAAYAALPDELQRRHQLVVGCKVTHHERRLLGRWSEAAGTVGEVIVTGFTSDDDLVRLYQSAEVVLFPSKYEGFGLPVLEARRCGAPVICSNVSSLPEVMLLESATFNPWDVDDVAAVLERSLTDATFRAELLTAPDPGLSFDQAADRTVEVYERVLAERRRRRSTRRSRLAVVTVLPPTPSGVADHSTTLVSELATLADVTCFVAGDAVDSEAALGSRLAADIRPLGLLPTLTLGGAFDAVLYTMGNNAHHRPFLESFERMPGHVLFHDVRLAGCYEPAERQAIFERWYQGSDLPLYVADVANRAQSCLVQSAHAAALLADDCGVAAVDVGPHPMQVLEQLAQSATAPHIVSMGIADITKQSHKFAAAADAALARNPGWQATIVGLGGERFAECTEHVAATGHVADADFQPWLDRATVLVQLRDASNGESSGVTAKALACGVPTIVTDLGAAAELPDDVVVKVARTITPDELADVIESLVGDAERRARLSAAAQAFAARHTYRRQAELILAAVIGPP